MKTTRTRRLIAILGISGALAGGAGATSFVMASHTSAPAPVQHVQADGGNGGSTLYRG